MARRVSSAGPEFNQAQGYEHRGPRMAFRNEFAPSTVIAVLADRNCGATADETLVEPLPNHSLCILGQST